MSFLKETSLIDGAMQTDRPEGVDAPKLNESDIPKFDQRDVPHWILDDKTGNHSVTELSDIFNSAFKSFGLTSESNEVNRSESSESSEQKSYSQYLEKGDDGKYYDKETGKTYDSAEDWVKTQETLAKRYESTAQYFEDKAKKEWARFKNAEQNGETNGEKWDHYRHSQQYYTKAKECREVATHIREKLNSVSDTAGLGNEVPGKDNLEVEGSFAAVPVERQEAVYDAFKNAPDEIKTLVNQYARYLSVEDIKETDRVKTCHYNLLDRVIRMESTLQDDEYAEIFSHEYGHFVDHNLDRPSNTQEFRDAMNKDLAQYDLSTAEGYENFKYMLDAVVNSDAAYDRAVSDILSAFFMNHPDIQQKFYDEAINSYGHSNEYWAHPGARECEVFANIFSMAAQGNTVSCEFIKAYFPNTWDQVMDILEGGAQ